MGLKNNFDKTEIKAAIAEAITAGDDEGYNADFLSELKDAIQNFDADYSGAQDAYAKLACYIETLGADENFGVHSRGFLEASKLHQVLFPELPRNFDSNHLQAAVMA